MAVLPEMETAIISLPIAVFVLLPEKHLKLGKLSNVS